MIVIEKKDLQMNCGGERNCKHHSVSLKDDVDVGISSIEPRLFTTADPSIRENPPYF